MSDLEIRGLWVERLGFPVVRGLSLKASRAQVTVILGPNGAGKTTLMEALAGILAAARGTITFKGQEIQKSGRVERARLGLLLVEQGRTVFPDLTTEENLLVAARTPANLEKIYDLFPPLSIRRQMAARLLSGGEQQMLVLGRALAAEPSMLLVDEMSLGLAPAVVSRLAPVVRGLADAGVGVVLVEQFAAMALGIGDRVYVLNRGSVSFEGSCADLGSREDLLRQAYLGERDG